MVVQRKKNPLGLILTIIASLIVGLLLFLAFSLIGSNVERFVRTSLSFVHTTIQDNKRNYDDIPLTPESEIRDKSVVQSPDIVATLKDLGVTEDYSDLNLIVVSKNDIKETCRIKSLEVLACYFNRSSGSSQKYIYTTNSYPNYATERQLIGHEFLHYIWYKHGLEDNTKLTTRLEALPHEYPELDKILDPYRKTSTGLKTTEIFSYGCTLIGRNLKDSYIKEQCANYLDLRRLRPVIE